jgi:hypothetical protein
MTGVLTMILLTALLLIGAAADDQGGLFLYEQMINQNILEFQLFQTVHCVWNKKLHCSNNLCPFNVENSK